MKAHDNRTAAGATLIVGADLRVSSSGPGWQTLGFGHLRRFNRQRIDELFPAGDLRASILDVLASGLPVEGILVPIEDNGKTRYLCASLSPLPAGAPKPKKVLLRAHELDGWIVANADTGEIISANEGGARAFGSDVENISGTSLWASQALTKPQDREIVLAALDRGGSRYLGRFRQTNSAGEVIEVEGVLIRQEEPR